MNLSSNLHLLVPGLAWVNEKAFAADLQLPALRTLLARAEHHPLPDPTPEAWLCAAFALNPRPDYPVAPFSFLGDGGSPEQAHWLRADPVHLRIHGDQLILLDSDTLNITAEEAEAMINALNLYFKTDGLTFYGPSPNRWYVSTEEQKLVTHTISEVTGKNVNPYLPSDVDGPKWNSISNEIQMLFFAHAVNQEREENQKLTINSVWFWGGGTLNKVGSPFSMIVTDDLFSNGLGVAANIDVLPLPANAGPYLASVKPGGEHLLTIETLEKPAQYRDIQTWRNIILALEEQWFKPLLQALKQNRLSTISIYAFGANENCKFKIQRGDLWKFWRRQV